MKAPNQTWNWTALLSQRMPLPGWIQMGQQLWNQSLVVLVLEHRQIPEQTLSVRNQIEVAKTQDCCRTSVLELG